MLVYRVERKNQNQVGGTVTVTASTFSGNSVGSIGGGIRNFDGTVTVTASTFSGNSAASGGGIFNSVGTVTVTASTFSGNSAASGGGGIANRGTLTLAHTIIANSPAGGECFDINGTPSVAGVNLIEDGSCDPTALTGDPLLGPLADNGGPTETHALLEGSPAIDAVPEDECLPPATDQRGEPRPVDGDGDGEAGCDLGAYEAARVFPFTGFFPPVDNLPTVNTVTAGRAIPVKFSLSGDQGLAILASGFPASQQIACDSSAPQAPIEETVSAGGSQLTYDAATDTYTYVWKTAKAWAGTCRLLILQLTDGSEHLAQFQF